MRIYFSESSQRTRWTRYREHKYLLKTIAKILQSHYYFMIQLPQVIAMVYDMIFLSVQSICRCISCPVSLNLCVEAVHKWKWCDIRLFTRTMRSPYVRLKKIKHTFQQDLEWQLPKDDPKKLNFMYWKFHQVARTQSFLCSHHLRV